MFIIGKGCSVFILYFYIVLLYCTFLGERENNDEIEISKILRITGKSQLKTEFFLKNIDLF